MRLILGWLVGGTVMSIIAMCLDVPAAGIVFGWLIMPAFLPGVYDD